MWGQALDDVDFWTFAGIIPTRVGTRTEPTSVELTLTDHPHACGDKHFIRFRDSLKLGSSPRVWGQGAAEGNKSKDYGIIPTRVGTRRYVQ